MQRLVAAYDYSLEFLGLLPGLLVAAIGIGTCADVLLRNLGYSGFYGMLDIVEYCLLLLPMVGAGFIMRIDRHVTVDILAEHLAPGPARWLGVVTALLGSAFCIIFLWYSIRATLDAYRSDALIQKAFIVPEWWALAVITFGFVFLTVEMLRRLFLASRPRRFRQADGTGRDGGI